MSQSTAPKKSTEPAAPLPSHASPAAAPPTLDSSSRKKLKPVSPSRTQLAAAPQMSKPSAAPAKPTETAAASKAKSKAALEVPPNAKPTAASQSWKPTAATLAALKAHEEQWQEFRQSQSSATPAGFAAEPSNPKPAPAPPNLKSSAASAKLGRTPAPAFAPQSSTPAAAPAGFQAGPSKSKPAAAPPMTKSSAALSNSKAPSAPELPKLTNEYLARPPAATWVPRCDTCYIGLEPYDPKNEMRCVRCRNVLDDWDSATEWQDLLDYNRDFIFGTRTGTPYSVYPLFEDEQMHEGLDRLHDYGIMVIDAAPDYHKIDQDANGKWFEIKERAYLRCVIPTTVPEIPIDKIEKMLDMLIDGPNLETVHYYEYADYLAGKMRRSGEREYRYAPPMIWRHTAPGKIPLYQCFRSSIRPGATGRTVAKHRVANTKYELEGELWKRCKCNSMPVITERELPPDTKGIRAFGRESPLTEELKMIVFTVAMRQWSSNEARQFAGKHLAAVVEFVATSVGLEPCFEDVVYSDAEDEEKEKAKMEELVKAAETAARLPTIFDRLAMSSKLDEVD